VLAALLMAPEQHTSVGINAARQHRARGATEAAYPSGSTGERKVIVDLRRPRSTLATCPRFGDQLSRRISLIAHGPACDLKVR
jgi:hypothetical protein